MKKEYIELYKVPIEEVYDFCPLQLRKMIIKKSIDTLGTLIELVEEKGVVDQFVDMRFISPNSDSFFHSYQAVMGTIKVLKYEYLFIYL